MVTETPERVNLKAELATRGLTQRQVAKDMGVSHWYLSRLINGHAPFSRLTARSFAMVTGIPLADIEAPND